jgi:hypothetical protein
MDARELLKDIITDVGTHTRKARMGLPLLRSNEKKKENHAERAQRVLMEDQLAEACYDHVCWFQQRSAHYDMQVKESADRVEPDAVDQDELDELEREVLGFEDDVSSESESESDSDMERKSKTQRKSDKNKGRFFRYYLF